MLQRAAATLLGLATVGALGLTAAAAGEGGATPQASVGDVDSFMEYHWNGEPVAIDWAGRDYHPDRAEDEFLGSFVAAPGDRVTRTLVVRNAGPETGELVVDFFAALGDPARAVTSPILVLWSVADEAGTARLGDVIAAGTLTAEVTQLAQDEAIEITLGWTYPADETLAFDPDQAEPLSFGVRLTLSGEMVIEEPEGPTDGSEYPGPPVQAPESSASGGAGGDTGSAGNLPFTGTDAGLVALIADGLIVIGWVVLFARRRRRQEEEQAGARHVRAGVALEG
jgi:hypothetical protein